MSKFVSQEPVPVHTEDDPANIIWIKPRMDVGTTSMVQSAMVSINMQANGTGRADNTSIRMDIGAYNLALMIHNFVRWEGPGFEGLPCNAENIKRLEQDDPLVEKALQEINRRNLSKVASPNSSNGAGKNGSTPSTAPTKPDESPSLMSELESTTIT